jgi:alkylhydroperoxidase family enzyme
VKGLDRATVTAVLEDWRTAPVSPRVRAALGFLETLTLRPSEVTPESVRHLRTAGLNDRAIREVIYVAFLFNMLDRLADAFDFPLPSEEGVRKIGDLAFRLGYGIAKLPG